LQFYVQKKARTNSIGPAPLPDDMMIAKFRLPVNDKFHWISKNTPDAGGQVAALRSETRHSGATGAGAGRQKPAERCGRRKHLSMKQRLLFGAAI
jgi:hypothetical protein